MVKDPDDQFYTRADAHIHLSNDQTKDIDHGKVSASMMYAGARFNAWVNATGFSNAEDMKKNKQETLEYFVSQYKIMLEENLDNYIENFSQFMKVKNN